MFAVRLRLFEVGAGVRDRLGRRHAPRPDEPCCECHVVDLVGALADDSLPDQAVYGAVSGPGQFGSIHGCT